MLLSLRRIKVNITLANITASFLKLNQPLQNTNHGQKAFSYMALYIWNSLPVSLKATEGLKGHLRYKTIFCYKVAFDL